MKDTNAIEKALKNKINEECKEIVDKFITDLEKLEKKYGCNLNHFQRGILKCVGTSDVMTTL